MKEQTRRKIKYITLMIIFMVCIACSALLVIDSEKICKTDCTDNEYKETFGINNGWYGAIIFTTLFMLAFRLFAYPKDNIKVKRRVKRILHLGIIIGSIIAIYFLYLQQFVLKEYCIYCLIIDIGLLVSLGIIILVRDKIVTTS